MSQLKDNLRADLKAAMKAKDTATTSTLRMLLSSLIAEETSGSEAKELSEDQWRAVLAREVKRRNEAAEVFEANGRAELASKERSEAEIISRYLPQQLDDEALSRLVDDAITQYAADSGQAPSIRDMGGVMKLATAKAAGAADGKRLSSIVRSRLT